MAAADAKKKDREWFISDRHEDILESTVRAREREQRLLQASLGSREKAAEKAASSRASKIAPDHLERILKTHIMGRYDEIIDAFNECDTNGNGRVRFACIAVAPCKSSQSSKTRCRISCLGEVC